MNLAAVIASNSFYVGGNWGFVLKENEEYVKDNGRELQDTYGLPQK